MGLTKGEKERIEKRKRIESIVVVVALALGVILYYLISYLSGEVDGVLSFLVKTTDAPAESPCVTVVKNMNTRFSGDAVLSEDGGKLTFLGQDGARTTVTVYPKNDIPCVRIVRELAAAQNNEVTEEPDPFVDLGGKTQEASSEINDPSLDPAAEEIADVLSYLDNCDANGLSERIKTVLSTVICEDASKANLLSGIYMIEFKYSKDDSLLTVVCEPA